MSTPNQTLCVVSVFPGLIICALTDYLVTRFAGLNRGMAVSRSAGRLVPAKLQLCAGWVLIEADLLSSANGICHQNCWTKPKFPPFEYCGKKCAAAANAKSGISNANVQTQVLPGVAGIQSMTNTAPNSNNYTKILPTRPFTQGPPPGNSK